MLETDEMGFFRRWSNPGVVSKRAIIGAGTESAAPETRVRRWSLSLGHDPGQ